MLIAINQDGERAKAEPGAKGKCPSCEGDVIAKCGSIKIWHWSHVAADCDPWTEPESDWHLWWKSLWPNECVEVTIRKNGILHRADICTPDGMVIELQHSALSPEKIKEREDFYGNMVWLFDLREAHEASRLTFRKRDENFTFKWNHARKSVLGVRRPAFWDVGYKQLFEMGNRSEKRPKNGTGAFRDWQILFINWGLCGIGEAIEKAAAKTYWEPHFLRSGMFGSLMVTSHIYEDFKAFLNAGSPGEWLKENPNKTIDGLNLVFDMRSAIQHQYEF